MKFWPFKSPDDVLDYTFNWKPIDLGSEAIVTTTAVLLEGDVVIESHAPAGDQMTTTWLSGGTIGMKSVLRLTVHTDTRIAEEDVSIMIRQR